MTPSVRGVTVPVEVKMDRFKVGDRVSLKPVAEWPQTWPGGAVSREWAAMTRATYRSEGTVVGAEPPHGCECVVWDCTDCDDGDGKPEVGAWYVPVGALVLVGGAR